MRVGDESGLPREHAREQARELLRRAGAHADDLCHRAPAVASAMQWRSRAAEEFTRAWDDWVSVVRGIRDEAWRWDAVLAARAPSEKEWGAPGGGR